MRVLPWLIAVSVAACATAGGENFSHVAPFDTLSPVPHSAAEIARFETYRGPGGEAARIAWRTHFLEQRLNRAFAASAHHVGYRVGAGSGNDAAAEAVRSCNAETEADGERCVVYAINTQIVMPGQEATLPFRGRPIGAFTPSPEYIYRGPEAARGLVVWSHGKTRGKGCDADGAKSAAFATITHFNRDGWDVVRFNRDPCRDDLEAALRAFPPGVTAAKQLGYRKIVLAGQSRGAFQSLEALLDPVVARQVDAVIAFSPARSGKAELAQTVAPQRWKALVDALANALTGPQSVAVFYFDKDAFNPHAREQAAYAGEVWRARMPNAHVYYDDDPGLTTSVTGEPYGHYGASRPAFATTYAACLTALIDTGRAEGACGR